MELLWLFEFSCCITFPICFYLSLDIYESLWILIYHFGIFEENMSDNMLINNVLFVLGIRKALNVLKEKQKYEHLEFNLFI